MRARRAVATFLTLTLAFSVLAAIPATTASASIATERPVYGRNQAVVVEVGQIYYTTACPTGVRDWLYPVADLYVIKGSTQPTGGLSDVSGTPNTVFGVTGGGIFGEIIGYTKPGGALGPGTYSVVIDECQDGQWGPEDTFVPDAFRVVSNVLGPQLPDIGAIKARAAAQADHYEQAVLGWKALLALSSKGQGSAGKAYGYFKKMLFGVGLPDPAALATIALGNQGKHWKGIAADPPDPAFDQPTVLAPTAVPGVLDPDDPIEALAADPVGALATSAALSESLLHSLERYQGAWAARDGEWQLAHARAIAADATLLADRLTAEAGALEDLADAVDALPGDYDTLATDSVAQIDAYLTGGPTPAELSDMANHGVSEGQLRAVLTSLRAELEGFALADLSAELRAIAADAPALATDLLILADEMVPVIETLEADDFVEGTVPVVDAGGPYTTTAGAELALTGVATGPGDLTYAWDLDGDGDFDDASGPTPTVAPTDAYTGVAGLRVTAPGGEAGVAYTPLTITDGPAGPSLTDRSPADRDVTVATGATQDFSVTAGGDSPSVTWYVDGTEADTGSTFTYAPLLEDAGAHLVEVAVADGTGQRAAAWYVTAEAPDVDGDGYWAHVDCDDTEPTTYPGAPEPLDGVDNDCDPTTPDGGVPPVVAAVADLAGPEGTTLEVVRSFTHPSGSGFDATVDWGDGTVTPGTITSKTVRASHAYADDGTYTVTVCVTPTAGQTACNTGTATISNVAAGPRFSTLFDWTEQEFNPNDGVWTVAPDGLSVFQSVNGNPTFFQADQPLAPGTEAGVTLTVETTGDDDYVGFALGTRPGFTTDPDAEYILVDWKKNDQGGGGGCDGDFLAERGLAVSRVWGTPPVTDMWPHTDCDPDDGSGVEEIARATNLSDTGWNHQTSYRFRFRYSETRLQIWVDDVLEFDLTGEFPQGHLAFYNYSQAQVRYSGYQLVPGDVVEGTERDFTVDFADPGTADTHTGLIDWGDGTPLDALIIDEADGAGTGTKSHRYLDDGTYDGEVCLTDDDGDTGCQLFPIEVANAPPAVNAGRDRVAGPALLLDDTSFTDPGILDTHTATVDWGDGSEPDDAAVAEALGEGIVTGGHTYTTDGTYTVEVCITDDDGGIGCDSFEADVRLANVGPLAETDPDAEITEGDVVTRTVGFTDANPGDTHTATIDWGDGTPVAELPLVSSGVIGSGGGAHVYLDDGEYEVVIEVCDADEACTTATSTVTVTNAPPVVDGESQVLPSAGGTATHSRPIRIDATFTDVGVEDTHTATIDWGDGTDPEPVTVDQGAGSGSLAGTHVYATPGAYEAEVCVTDDDGGIGCTPVAVDAPIENQPPAVEAPDIEGTEGVDLTWSFSLTDEPGDTHTATIDWGDGTEPEPVTVDDGQGTGTHRYVDDGDYEISIEVCDQLDVCATAPATATVDNSPPEVEATATVVGAGGNVEPRRSLPVDLAATFTDLGVEDTHTATIDWGDGTDPEPVTVDQGAGSGSLAGTHVYATPGTYEIEVCVTDDDGGLGCALVVADPTGQPPGPPLEVSAIGGDANARVRWNPPLDDGGSALLTYQIETTPGGDIVTVDAATLVTIIEELDNDTDYTFRVRASNEYGYGPWSLPSNLTRPRPSCPGAIFDDVGADHPFCPEIKWMADTGVSVGFPGNVYRPAVSLTRQQMAAFSYRLLNPGVDVPTCTTRPFTDVAVDNPLCGEIAWMKAEGISTGRPDGSFGPAAPVTRQVMAAFLYRLTDPGGPEPAACAADEFPDVPASDLFCGHIDWLVNNGITGGFEDGTFRPTTPVARQQMAAFILRYNILTGHIA